MYKFENHFDNEVIVYEESRPLYVKELYDDIFKYKKINDDSNVLEIGIGTGKASMPILKTNCHLTGIEPGKHLTEVCKDKYKEYNNFSIYNKTLQDYACPPDHMSLEKTDRENLFSGIYDAINKYGGVITVYYTIDLQLARKL